MALDHEETRQTLEARLRFETLLVSLSSRFVRVAPDELNLEIDAALAQVCQALDINQAVLWQWSESSPGALVPTNVYPSPESQPAVAEIRQEDFPWVKQEMDAGRVVACAVNLLPPDAAIDQESARRLGIKATICIPLSTGGQPPVGVLAFNDLHQARDWPREIVDRLRLLAEVFANALQRRRADHLLRESEEVNRATFEGAAVGVAHVAIDGRWLRVNDRLCGIVGYSREELLTIGYQDITCPDDLPADEEAVRRLLAGEANTCCLEKRYVRKDGSLVNVNLSVAMARRPDGEPGHFIAVVDDITERKRAEDDLRTSEARLRASADLVGVGYYEVDFVAGVSYFDARLFDLLGVPPDGRKGIGPMEFFLQHVHPDDRAWFLDVREQLHSGKLWRTSVEHRYLHPVRGQVWLQHYAGIVARVPSGRPAESHGAIRDITKRKEAEEALLKSYAVIEKLKDRLQAETDYLRAEIGVASSETGITGNAAPIRNVLRLVGQVAPTRSTVLITGETGTGKELLARAIHQQSPRSGRVMVNVNCAAMPSGLVESELFGREKGAYTGSLSRQIGRFELADGSTIFMDEVGELSLEVQAKLLRVLEVGEFERLGSPRTLKTDVRVIAATNRDLAEEVRKGRFREDLFYRLNVFPIQMPALRERAEDIPRLVWTFVEEFSSRMGKKITQVPRQTMEALQRQRWPGNVRELRNVIEHAAIISEGDTLRVAMADFAPVGTARKTLADLERAHIIRTLGETGGKVKGPDGAATRLGINPATLYSRMKKLGIRKDGTSPE